MKVALLGGTGGFGTALAVRLREAGYDVVIGSRDAERAQAAAAELGVEGATNDYLINGQLTAGTAFSATLDWFLDRQTSGTTGFFEGSYDNLDLELWNAVGGVANQLIAESSSLYNNVEHFRFEIPTTGQYMLRVRWAAELFDQLGDANSEQYGLAWSGTAVPEPGTFVILGCVLPVVLMRRRRK